MVFPQWLIRCGMRPRTRRSYEGHEDDVHVHHLKFERVSRELTTAKNSHT